MEYTETQLDNLIEARLSTQLDCDDLPRVCRLLTSHTGKIRVHNYVKDKLLNQGLRSINSALALAENNLFLEEEA